MSYLKYVVKVDQITIALKYDPEYKEGVVGGMSKYVETMSEILNNYFEAPKMGPSFVQKNKCRFAFSCSFDKFREGIQLMKLHSIYVEPATNLQTIMR